MVDENKGNINAYPNWFKDDIVRMFYVMEYGWQMAKLYIKNQRATELGLPFVPALPDKVVTIAKATRQSFKVKRVNRKPRKNGNRRKGKGKAQ